MPLRRRNNPDFPGCVFTPRIVQAIKQQLPSAHLHCGVFAYDIDAILGQPCWTMGVAGAASTAASQELLDARTANPISAINQSPLAAQPPHWVSLAGSSSVLGVVGWQFLAATALNTRPCPAQPGSQPRGVLDNHLSALEFSKGKGNALGRLRNREKTR